MQTSRDVALARIDTLLASGPGDVATRVHAAVQIWLDTTLHDDDAEDRDRFERRLATAIAESKSGAWCDGEVTVLDLARTFHTCARVARLSAAREPATRAA